MNILLLTTHLNSGGITSYLLTLTKGLIERGHSVSIASSGGNTEADFRRLKANLLTLNIRTKSELSPKIYWALSPLKRFAEENKIDVIHAQTRVTQVIGYWLKRLTKKMLVATCHGFFRPRFFRRIFSCWGDRTIAISEQVQEHLIKDFHVSLERIALVNSGVDTDAYKPASSAERSAIRKKYNFKDNDPLVGMIARLSDVKGQDILIQAMPKIIAALPSIKLLLVGEGKMEAKLKSLVANLDLGNSVQFLPIVNQTQEILSMLDVFVNPSRQEGLGLSIMEAQSSGLPVVASMLEAFQR